MTLLHFIALTVREKYPELATFWQELHFVEKAAAGAPPVPAPPSQPLLGPWVPSDLSPLCPCSVPGERAAGREGAGPGDGAAAAGVRAARQQRPTRLPGRQRGQAGAAAEGRADGRGEGPCADPPTRARPLARTPGFARLSRTSALRPPCARLAWPGPRLCLALHAPHARLATHSWLCPPLARILLRAAPARALLRDAPRAPLVVRHLALLGPRARLPRFARSSSTRLVTHALLRAPLEHACCAPHAPRAPLVARPLLCTALVHAWRCTALSRALFCTLLERARLASRAPRARPSCSACSVSVPCFARSLCPSCLAQPLRGPCSARSSCAPCLARPLCRERRDAQPGGDSPVPVAGRLQHRGAVFRREPQDHPPVRLLPSLRPVHPLLQGEMGLGGDAGEGGGQ